MRHIFKLLFQGRCSNINGNATDVDEYDCEHYDVYISQDPKSCGKYDDRDFNAKEMCCTCGGGIFGNRKSQFENKITLKF